MNENFKALQLKEDYLKVVVRVKSAELPSKPVVLIAVSKTKSVEEIECLYNLGQRDFGENYAQELVEKAEYFSKKGFSDIRWHMIGHLQTNKVKKLLPIIFAIHTVDRMGLAKEIEKECIKQKIKTVPIFIEVNIDGEAEKSGVLPGMVQGLMVEIQQFEHLSILGLMGIPDPNKNTQLAFRELSTISNKLGVADFLSMGMSSDFEAAIKEGATHIRVGSLIFGERLKG
jgi:PLP dependent protein